MKLEDFDYHLPPELIAQYPPEHRGASRLLVYDRRSGQTTHTAFPKITEYLKKGDALVVNNTKVFKARLWGHRATGGRVEVFLVRKLPAETGRGEQWEALVSPSRRVKEGERIHFDDRQYVILDQFLHEGSWLVRFESRSQRVKAVREFGHMPLPPYIRREDAPTDLRRYQTVFAGRTHEGAVAAPTAGLHFTRDSARRDCGKGGQPD